MKTTATFRLNESVNGALVYLQGETEEELNAGIQSNLLFIFQAMDWIIAQEPTSDSEVIEKNKLLSNLHEVVVTLKSFMLEPGNLSN
jgi:hypothetical protein